MRSSRHSTLPSPNAFSPAFLQRIAQRDEPPSAGEADVAGPWHIEEVPGGFGLFRLGESQSRGFDAYAVFRDRWLALLAAAVLPGTGRDYAFLLEKEADAEGFAIADGANGAVLGHVALFDEFFVDALNVAAALVRLPGSLAALLEAAGQVSLERAGAILDDKVS
ncbi:MAG TPA: hypothetical protein VGS07_29550 [Thermoanaerobaculia bacterium]|jgi:hypothetical protein|nr:hypothetical protein [Thermoanaerobaculia bacterium]